jgi:general secretion pathway protein G
MDPSSRGRRPGFTLLEILTVILIITLLLALLVPAVNAGRLRARKAAIKLEVGQLANGLTQSKDAYGSYPPGRAWSHGEIEQYLRRAFRRMHPVQLSAAATLVRQMSEAELLVFWLGGRWDNSTMVGLALNPQNPFSLAEAQRTAPFVNFDVTRLDDSTNSNGFPEYYPPGGRPGESAPYLYFAARPSGSYLDSTGVLPVFIDHRGVAKGGGVPYYFKRDATSAAAGFVNADSYQLICAGIDNDYGPGVAKGFPFGQGHGEGDRDNIVNFSTQEIGDAVSDAS